MGCGWNASLAGTHEPMIRSLVTEGRPASAYFAESFAIKLNRFDEHSFKGCISEVVGEGGRLSSIARPYLQTFLI